MRIVAENYVDVSTITSVPSNTTIDNLKSYARSKVLTTELTDTSIELSMTMGAQAPVSTVIIGRHNLKAGMTVQIELYSGVFSTLVHDSGIMTVTSEESSEPSFSGAWGEFIWGEYPFGVELFSTPNLSYVYWVPTTVSNVLTLKITIDGATSAMEIGRLIVGDYIEPTHTISYGHTLSWLEKTRQDRAGSEGSLRSTVKAPAKRITFSLNTINENDRPIIQNAFRYSGLRKDLYISLFPEDENVSKLNDYSGIMKLTKIPSISEYAPVYYKSSYTMEEV